MAWVVVAIVGVLLLIAYPKPVLSIIAFASLAIGGLLLWEYRREEQRSRENQRVQVTADTRVPSPVCSDEMPISVRFVNGSKRKINAINWSLSIRRKGHSSNLIDGYYPAPKMDKILAPGEGAAWCYSIPKLTYEVPREQLEAFAELGWVDFAND